MSAISLQAVPRPHACRTRRSFVILLLAAVALLAALPAAAQTRPTAGYDRLFLSFVEDATVIENQWWEGQLELTDGDLVDSTILRGIVALRPFDRVEVGARVGFGSTDTAGGLPDGSGATDLDLWGKYYFESPLEDFEIVAGGLVTVPTGDDTAGLGYDAFSVAGFGAIRKRFPDVILSAHVGFRMNGDGMTLGLAEIDGELSTEFGVGVIAPISEALTIVGEFDFESNRFKGGENDSRLLGGVNWRTRGRGIVRAALSFGLTDGAPDSQLLAGWATRF